MPRGIPGSGGGNYGITINAKVKGQQNIKRLGNSMQGVQGSAKNLAMSLKGLVGPLAALGSAAAIFKTFQTSFQVVAEREADFATLANGLKRVSTDAPKAAKALRGIADELGFETLFDEKAFQKGFALLTSFKNIGIDSYSRVAETAADLAQINQVDLKSSFLQLAKALSDPTRGLTALSRSGVIFTEQQREMILALHESGQEMEAQAEILRIVEGSYKGAARAAAEGLAGSFDSLGQKVRDFNEALGRAAEPLLEPLVDATVDFFDLVTQGLNAISGDMVIFAKNIETALKPVFKWIIEQLKEIGKFITETFSNIADQQLLSAELGPKEFAKRRKELFKQAESMADEQFVPKDVTEGRNYGQRIKDALLNPLSVIRPELIKKENAEALRELREDLFQDLLEQEVQNLGLKPVIPELKEVKAGLKENITTLEGLKLTSDETGDSLDKTFGQQMQAKLKTFKDGIKSIQESMADVVIKGIKGMEDALVNFVMTGKLSFRDLANSIIKDMIRIQIQQSITKPLSNFFSSLFTKNANGNVYGQNGIVPFANGGIVTKPTVFPFKNGIGLMGEAGAEAILPLTRRNGKLGVEGGGNNTSVVVNVDASGTEVQGDEQQGRALGQLIAAAVQSELVQQSRPGGILNPA